MKRSMVSLEFVQQCRGSCKRKYGKYTQAQTGCTFPPGTQTTAARRTSTLHLTFCLFLPIAQLFRYQKSQTSPTAISVHRKPCFFALSVAKLDFNTALCILTAQGERTHTQRTFTRLSSTAASVAPPQTSKNHNIPPHCVSRLTTLSFSVPHTPSLSPL